MNSSEPTRLNLKVTNDWRAPLGQFRVIRVGTFGISNADVLSDTQGDFPNLTEALQEANSYPWDRILWSTMAFYIVDDQGNLIIGTIEESSEELRQLILGASMPPILSI